MKDLYLVHYGIKGQSWGRRRFQNKDGTLTPAGERRYGDNDASYRPGSGGYSRTPSGQHNYYQTGSGGRSYRVHENVYREKFGGGGYYTSSSSRPEGNTHGGTYGRYGSWTSSDSRRQHEQWNRGLSEQRRQQTKAPGSESMDETRGRQVTVTNRGERQIGSVVQKTEDERNRERRAERARQLEGATGKRSLKDQRNQRQSRESDNRAPGSENQNTLRFRADGSHVKSAFNTATATIRSLLKTKSMSKGKNWLTKYFGQTR